LDIEALAEAWIDIEDDPMVIQEEVEAEIEATEAKTQAVECGSSVDQIDDEPPDAEPDEALVTTKKDAFGYLEAFDALDLLMHFFEEKRMWNEVALVETLESRVREHQLSRTLAQLPISRYFQPK